MEYLVTLSPQGITVLYETYNIKRIDLFQQVNIPNMEGIYYMVVIEYDDGHKENTVISNDQWNLWNKYQAGELGKDG